MNQPAPWVVPVFLESKITDGRFTVFCILNLVFHWKFILIFFVGIGCPYIDYLICACLLIATKKEMATSNN